MIALQSICTALLELAVGSRGEDGDEEFWLSTAADVVDKVCSKAKWDVSRTLCWIYSTPETGVL